MSSPSCTTQASDPTLQSAASAPPTPEVKRDSYGQILKSSALIGGSSVLNIGVGIIRMKAMALLLGPAGVGLLGLYNSIADLVHSVAGMGINNSGVRQIAEASASGNQDRLARTALVLKRISFVLGLLGAILLVGFCTQFSSLTFGTGQNAAAVALLSLAVLFRCVSGGQSALIQGMRRISDLAKMSVLSAFLGMLVSVPIVYFYRESGIVPSIIGVAAMMLATSWWYSRKVQIQPVSMTTREVGHEAAAFLKLGLAFMASGLMMMGLAYAVRIIVLRKVGFEAAGLYQSAWTLGGLYVGLILQAMGTDFYPRLTASAQNNPECNRLVNEQALISLLLAGPGVLGTLTFASLVITMFYSSEFSGAVETLRWICLGMTLRVITWPMGFILLAKGAQRAFFFTELAFTAFQIVLALVCVNAFGLNGAGIAFFGSYVFHGLMIYPIVRHLSGFRWSSTNVRTGVLFLSIIGLVFSSFFLLQTWWAIGIGAAAAVFSGWYSLRTIARLVSFERIPAPLRRLMGKLGFTGEQ